MRALDLFCGAGGASMGLRRAGFEVTGVDLEPQPRYPFTFIQADALAFPDGGGFDLGGFDLVWASPPCQRCSIYSRNLGTAASFPDLITPVREHLKTSGVPYIIENVVGAPLKETIQLCGTQFGLQLIRHRLFEIRPHLSVLLPSCNHKGTEIPVYGGGTPQWHRRKWGRNVTDNEKRAAMEIDWMTRAELSQAIPPAYSEFLARRFLDQAG